MSSPLPALTAFALVVTVGLGGCLEPPVYTIDISTSYDPNKTYDQTAQDQAETMGFDAGDPADRENPELLFDLRPPSDRSRAKDLAEAERRDQDAVLGFGLYRIPLDEDGKGRFRVQTAETAQVSWIGVVGPLGGSHCSAWYAGSIGASPTYRDYWEDWEPRGNAAGDGGQGEVTAQGAQDDAKNVGPTVEEDLSIVLHFGIRCPDEGGS